MSRPELARAVRSTPGFGAGMVGLLAVSVFINYIDRGVLATGAPLMKAALGLSTMQIGLLLSAFFWSYTPCQLLAGWLSERINPYRTLALGVALWSIATAATGLAGGFAALVALRLLLGLGESAAVPCCSKMLAQHLPQHRLGMGNGVLALGLALGPAFGTLAGGLVMARWGWRAAFLIFGVLSSLWLVPWLAGVRRLPPEARAAPAGPQVSLAAIFRERDLWGAGLGHFAVNYSFYFVIFWLPLYLVQERGFTVSQMAVLGGGIYLAYAASAFATGALSDWLMRAGGSSTAVRKGLAVTSQILVAAGLCLGAIGDGRVAVAGLFVAGIAQGLMAPTLYAIGQTLAGPRVAGKWIGAQNFLGNIAGLVGPALTGFVIQKAGGFPAAFAIAASVSLLGALFWGLVVRRVEPIAWRPSGLAVAASPA